MTLYTWGFPLFHKKKAGALIHIGFSHTTYLAMPALLYLSLVTLSRWTQILLMPLFIGVQALFVFFPIASFSAKNNPDMLSQVCYSLNFASTFTFDQLDWKAVLTLVANFGVNIYDKLVPNFALHESPEKLLSILVDGGQFLYSVGEIIGKNEFSEVPFRIWVIQACWVISVLVTWKLSAKCMFCNYVPANNCF